jgi:small-conductance mechanosensitive channel
LTVLIGFIVAKFYKSIVDRYRKSNTIKSLSASRMLANSGYYLIMICTFFVALKVVGLDMHTIFLTIGALLLWVSLGLQGFISNYAMGILLRINRSIRIGDFIEVDSKISGLVDDMDFRSVIIVTDDNIRVIIPNSKFISNSFINHSLEESIKRIHISFSVDRGIDFPQIQKEILSSLNRSNIAHIKQLGQKAQVIISDINKDAVRYSLLVWVNHQNRYDEVLEKSAFLSLIHQSLKKVAL